ncbi:MAG TPA: DNA mismatch repair endonuclease MutL [Bryobacteraceae bacterium]|nr:DNA mismatch repair endonuclease MutL [Bryobacteraceae bacterium]HOQ47484.1 DNA mismatch repair endonuclease MutL [Bryobacteraceae bacterium]HPQ15246.1 DNA mismatch repair endonuclease MutL [Bryobacteraceae bacterium]HPU73199.1 DNA mismatch repair endonuclease MutL [Bryobacteraceae bacterium]
MGRIRILSDDVANKIAAGEVVERPASVVKELLENSLDAGANRLRIEVESGGRRLIRVTDNGCGMLRDDAMLAFERHATSKLSSAKDLLSISTLGFRGEALPSVASVSRLLLETRAVEEPTGTRVEIVGGKMVRAEEAALVPGTQVTVRDLFFNVPARKKFLRSEQTELAHIASLVTHYSLANPDKTFLLTSDGKELLNVTPVENLRDRVYQVFGSQTLEELVDIGVRTAARNSERPYTMRGFVSRPQVQKLNRNSIFLFVNGRLIRDRLLLHAITSAYRNLIPPGTFPFALLFIECDAGEVDVNVHPSKTEVRFREQSFVHDFVRDALLEALMESKPVSAIPLPASAQPAARAPYSEFSQALIDQSWQGPSAMPQPAQAAESALPEFTLRAPQRPPARFDFSDEGIPVREPLPPEPPLRLPVPETHGGFPPELVPDLSQSLTALADLRPLGQIHDSFIVAAGRDGLWIVDQHVAHERILFEKVLKQRAAGRVETQRLLMPLIIQLTPAQQADYDRIAGELEALGFEAEPFGQRTIAVKAAPAGISPSDIERVIFEILEIAERELRRVSLDDLRRGIAASIACRAAIKVNTRLDNDKIEWLLKSLAATDCPMSCPHGRPIALRYSLRDILKGFHRM